MLVFFFLREKCYTKMFFYPSISSRLHEASVPVPLWCTAESTALVSRFAAAGVAPWLDAHFQRLGCIHPLSFWADWWQNMQHVTDLVYSCLQHKALGLDVASVHVRSYLLIFCLFVPFNNYFDMRWPSRPARLVCPVRLKEQIIFFTTFL